MAAKWALTNGCGRPKLWMTAKSRRSVFSLLAADGEEGYPGNLSVTLTYRLVGGDALRLTYTAESDQDTVMNLTNHTYFNLNGREESDILDTRVRIAAEYITPVDARLIPTGELRPVEGTPFDFREERPLAGISVRRMNSFGSASATIIILCWVRIGGAATRFPPGRRKAACGWTAIPICPVCSFIPPMCSGSRAAKAAGRFGKIRASVWKRSFSRTVPTSRPFPRRCFAPANGIIHHGVLLQPLKSASCAPRLFPKDRFPERGGRSQFG